MPRSFEVRSTYLCRCCVSAGGLLKKQAVVGKMRGTRIRITAWIITFLILFASFSGNALAQINVYTRSYDNAHSGANLQETTLTPANVNATNFGKIFTVHTDGQIFAQPLYVSNLTIAG